MVYIFEYALPTLSSLKMAVKGLVSNISGVDDGYGVSDNANDGTDNFDNANKDLMMVS